MISIIAPDAVTKQTIFNAWVTDPNLNIYLYVVWGISYAFTLVFSILGSVPIFSTNQFAFWFLVVDAINKLSNINFPHSAAEANIWTWSNWFIYSFRRVFVDLFLNIFHIFT